MSYHKTETPLLAVTLHHQVAELLLPPLIGSPDQY